MLPKKTCIQACGYKAANCTICLTRKRMFTIIKDMRKTFLYEARVSQKTTANAAAWIETCRTLYNVALDQRKSAYRQFRKTITCYDQCNELPDLKKEFPEFKAVGSQVLQDVLERLEKRTRRSSAG